MMAFNHAEICVKLFVAFFMVMCDASHLQYSTTPKSLFQPGPNWSSSVMQKHDETTVYMGTNTIQEEAVPDNLKVTEEKQFYIHLQIQNSLVENSRCHVLKLNGKSTTNLIERNCYIIVHNLDETDLEFLNQLEIFCQLNEDFNYQAHIERTGILDSSRCESMAKVGNGHKISTTADAETAFKSEFLIRICENMELLNPTKINNSESSTCLRISKTHLQYKNQQCCTGSFHFIPKGVLQVEVVMLWLEKDGYSYIIELCYSLSFICLFIIFASGIVSRNYRSERGNQILIHFAFSIFAQIMLHVIACFIKISSFLCSVQSISFHYFTLVESCWTSIIGYLQYKRFVKVFDNEPNHLILKLCAIAYISPICPITFWIIYNDSNPELVNYLTFGLPEFLILLINSTLLILITKNIVFVKHEYIEPKKSLSMEVKLIFFLFFVLDFSWFQIILAHLTSNKIFIYLFLFTQSSQGFMLFLVFGIMNDHNRLIYKKFFVIYLGKLFRR